MRASNRASRVSTILVTVIKFGALWLLALSLCLASKLQVNAVTALPELGAAVQSGRSEFAGNENNNNNKSESSASENSVHLLNELPRPVNISVLIISWYPPILKLSWNLNELSESDAKRLDFYEKSSNQSGAVYDELNKSQEAATSDRFLADQFDLELAIEAQTPSSKSPIESTIRTNNNNNSAFDESRQIDEKFDLISEEDQDGLLLDELRDRRALIQKSLTCFQVTYNIINSRFKVIEEYPPYFRSIMLERLLPATEYSLRVVAVYLGKYKLPSDRVQFISPTDNESRRFKENTYRPIHRYPDEKPELRIGLAQVRSEELTIVAIAIIFWIATICLFFNKWGKIRMLEPYQPAYRETSPASFAHHHPSAHNLLNSTGGSGSGGTAGSGALVGIGARMSSLCGPPAGLVGVGVACPNGFMTTGGSAASGTVPVPATSVAAPAAAVTTPTAAAPVGLAEPLVAVDQLRQRSSEGALALSCRERANRKLLLLRGNKRYETMAADDSSVARRTDAQLGYLFQSKALALAKATSIWSRQQQQLTTAPANPAAAARRLLELSRASPTRGGARLRQHQNAAGNLLKLSSLDSPEAGSGQLDGAPRKPANAIEPNRRAPSPVNRGHSVSSRGQMLKYQRQRQAIDLSGSSGLARLGSVRSLDRAGRSDIGDQPEQSAQDTTWQAGAGKAPSAGARQDSSAQSTNKLRRMMFTSKSHQHHHLATSSSSMTLMSPSPVRAGWARMGLAPAMNSASLDYESEVRLSSLGGNGNGASAASVPANIAAPWQTGEPSESVRRDVRSPMAKLGPLQLRSSPQQKAKLAGEHHILIEPPSPPNKSTRVGCDSPVSKDKHLAKDKEDLLAGSASPAIKLDDLSCDFSGEPSGAKPVAAADSSKSVAMKCRLLSARSQSGQQPPEGESFKEEEEEEEWEGGEQCECERQIEIGLKQRATVTNTVANPQQQQLQLDACPDKMMALGSFGHLANNNGAPGDPSQQPALSKPFQPAICLEEAQSDTPLDFESLQHQHQHQQQQQQQLDSANDAFIKLANYQSQSSSMRSARSQLAACGAPTGSRQLAQLSHCGDYLLHQSFGAQAEHNHHRQQLLARQRQLQQQLQIQQQQQQLPQLHQPALDRLQSSACLCGASEGATSCTALWPAYECCSPGEEAWQAHRQTSGVSDKLEVRDTGGGQWQANRPRMSSVFVASPYSRAHRDSFALLRALSQKKSKSAEDVAYLSSLVLQIWVRDRNPLLQSVSQQQLSARRQSSALSASSNDRGAGGHSRRDRDRPKSSLTVAHI